MGEAEGFVEREELIAAVTGHKVEIGREAIRELTGRLDDLPAHLAREEAVFRRPDMVEAAANAAAGLIGVQALKTSIERLRRNPEIERLEPKKPTAESRAGMIHTEVYSTRHNLELEQAVKDMAEAMAADTGHGLPQQTVKEKVETLLEQGYALSQEQSLAIRHATVKGGRVAVIEGAAGSGKTTTLRPITDLHKEHGYEIVPTAVAWRTAVALGDDCDARAYCVDKLLKLPKSCGNCASNSKSANSRSVDNTGEVVGGACNPNFAFRVPAKQTPLLHPCYLRSRWLLEQRPSSLLSRARSARPGLQSRCTPKTSRHNRSRPNASATPSLVW